MKKFGIILLITLLCLSVSGCSATGDVTQSDQKYVVSAIGFDNENGLLSISIEAVAINSESTDEELKLRMLTGKGETVEAALSNIGGQLTKPLLLSHCGVIIIGQSLTQAQIEQISDYCFKEKDITLSAFLISAESSPELLSCDTISSIAVGYDIMGVIEQQSTRTGINFKNRYYQIESTRNKVQNVYSLPFFKTKEKDFELDGIVIYENDSQVARLDNEQTVLYSIITDSFTSGKLLIANKEYKVKRSFVKYNFSDSKGKLITDLTIKLTFNNNSSDVTEDLKNSINSFINQSKIMTKTDIFGFGNMLHLMNKNLWNRTKSDYANIYRNSDIRVKIII